jgi:hypothetical protein
MENTLFNNIKQNLPSNFDMVYDFMIENQIEISKMDQQEREHILMWVKKVFDFVLEYQEKDLDKSK